MPISPVTIAVLVAAIAMTLAGCDSIAKDSTAQPPATSAPPAAAPSAAPSALAGSPSDDGNLTGPPGTAFTVTGDNGPNGATTVYDVTMTQVVQRAHLGQYESLSNGSDHVTAAEFKITGQSGQTSDDADNDAVVVGTDGQDYTPVFDTITEGTNFNGGDFRVGPGQSVTGWVAFELPPGVKIASVQWQPGISQTATWEA